MSRSREEVLIDLITKRGPEGAEKTTIDNATNLFLTFANDRDERIILTDFLVGLIDCTGVVTITATITDIDSVVYGLTDLDKAVAVDGREDCLDGMELILEPGEILKFYATNAVNEDKKFNYRYYWKPGEDKEIIGDDLL